MVRAYCLICIVALLAPVLPCADLCQSAWQRVTAIGQAAVSQDLGANGADDCSACCAGPVTVTAPEQPQSPAPANPCLYGWDSFAGCAATGCQQACFAADDYRPGEYLFVGVLVADLRPASTLLQHLPPAERGTAPTWQLAPATPLALLPRRLLI